MTRKSKRELEQRLEGLESEGSATVSGDKIAAWIQTVAEDGADAERPPEFFAGEIEWSDEWLGMRETAAKRFPPFKHLTPLEVYVLSYMGEDTAEALIDLLVASEDEAARKWRRGAMELADS